MKEAACSRSFGLSLKAASTQLSQCKYDPRSPCAAFISGGHPNLSLSLNLCGQLQLGASPTASLEATRPARKLDLQTPLPERLSRDRRLSLCLSSRHFKLQRLASCG